MDRWQIHSQLDLLSCLLSLTCYLDPLCLMAPDLIPRLTPLSTGPTTAFMSNSIPLTKHCPSPATGVYWSPP